MVNAETVAEDTLQTLHYLYSECYLGQKIEHLAAAFYLLLYQTDINLCLPRPRHALQKHWLAGRLDIIEGTLLCRT